MTETINVLITIPFSEDLIAKLKDVSSQLVIHAQRVKKVEEVEEELWNITQVLYTVRVLPPPELAPNLRWIQFHWAGINHALDAPIMQKPNLIATTLSGVTATQVSEYIVMMLLSWGHHLPDLLAAQRRGEWPKDRWERFSPRELRGSTVGIVGYGSIGRQTARVLNSFGAKVLATKLNAMHPEDSGYTLPGFGDEGGNFVHRLYPPEALHSMLKLCDFVVITLPLTSKTRGLIDREALAVLKPTAVLVDISRGGIVDHTALIEALHDRKIFGASLDVYPEEPLPADSPLWKLPNVILTPHISGNTPYYDLRAVEFFAENLKRFLEGVPLYNQFDPSRGY